MASYDVLQQICILTLNMLNSFEYYKRSIHILYHILDYIEHKWVSEWFSLTAFLRTADIKVHIVHTSRIIIAYTLKSLSSLT